MQTCTQKSPNRTPIFGKDSTNHIQNKQVLSEHGLIFAKLTSTFLLKQLISDSSDNRNSVRNNSCKGNVTNRLKKYASDMAKKTASPPRIIFQREPNSHYRHRKGSVPRHRKPAAGHAIHHARLRGRELVFSGRAAFFDGKRTDGIVPLRFIPQQTLLRRLAPQGGMGFGDHLRRGPDYGRSRDHRGTTGDIERQRKILCFRPFLPSLRGVSGT